MQYRLSTIFLVFFFVAATLALFGTWGIWIAAVLAVAALLFNKADTTIDGAIRVFYVILIGIVCPGVLWPLHGSREPGYRANCMNNLQQIGRALVDYEFSHGHFPAVNTCDKTGKPLYSWLVNILPELERRDIYDAINKDETWNSPNNARVLNKAKLKLFDCPSMRKTSSDLSSNYIAIIGPGTIWRKEAPIGFKDLPHPSELTVMAIECVTSDKHWAEPYTLTAVEALERMKTGKGMRISSTHPSVVNVVFADGHTDCLRSDMPISQWRKLLMGELKSEDDLHSWQEDPNDPPAVNISVYQTQPKPSEWAFKLSILVWLISVALLFYRAWASRELPAKP